ncbi:MAG: hypothetical protein P4L64_01720 [Caulobacteraceae bacterium]|nr:hypothetical protein [Caulobacteraceae bacterium]
MNVPTLNPAAKPSLAQSDRTVGAPASLARLAHRGRGALLALLLAVGALVGGIALSGPVAAQDDPINGVWNLKGKVEGFPVYVRCEFERHGDQLAGLCRDGGYADGTPHTLTSGVILGNHVIWTYRRHFLTRPYEPQYTGIIDGATMKGTILVAGHEGHFAATRQ